MARLDLVVRGGTVCTASQRLPADVGIRDGTVAQIGGEMQADHELDAAGKLLLPAGVDAHVHLSTPGGDSDPVTWVDDFSSGSAAAFAGGVTSLGNMTFLRANEGLLAGLEREVGSVRQQASADVFLHPVLAAPSPSALAEIPRLLEVGCSSIKIFMPTSVFDTEARSFIEATRCAGASGLITMFHCEDFALLEHATARLVANGTTSLAYFPESRPTIAEVLATQRAVAIAEATGAPVYVVHLSSERALAVCAEAQGRGLPVFVETRPLYLHLTRERFQEAECGRYVGQPPLRGHHDVDALWAGIQQGVVNTVCTDHAPWALAAKLDPALSITRLRPGVENLQTLVPMLYSEGVRTGRISLSRLIEVTSTNAAKLFGLYPRKGTIAVGSDADIVIFDPDRDRTVHAAMLKSNADYSVYEGWRVTGWPTLTLRRGEVVFRDDQVVAQPGTGSVMQCKATAQL